MKQRDYKECYSSEEENSFDEFKVFPPEQYAVSEKQETAAEDLSVDEISDGTVPEEKTKEENPLLENQKKEMLKTGAKTVTEATTAALPSAAVVTSAVAVVSASILGIVPLAKTGCGEVLTDTLSVAETASALTVRGEIEDGNEKYRYGVYFLEYKDGEAITQRRGTELVFEDATHFTFSFPLSYGLDSYSYTLFATNGSETEELYTATGRYQSDQSYQAEYRKTLPTESKIDFLSDGRYRVSIDTGFHTENPEIFSYALEVLDEEGKVYGSYSGTDSSLTLEINPLSKMYFRYTDLGSFYSGTERYQEYLSSDYSWIVLPTITLSDDYEFMDDQFVISYQTESQYESDGFAVILNFDNGTESFKKGLPFSVEQYPVFLDGFSDEAGTVKVTGYLDFQDERLDPYPHRIPIREKEYQMNYSFVVSEVTADHLETGQDTIPLTLNFDYQVPSTYQIRIENTELSLSETFSVTETYSLNKIPSGDGGTISLSIDRPDGTKWKDLEDIKVHSKEEVEKVYSSPTGWNNPNPGESLVTYNEDGTINLYRDMNFTSDDGNLYYDSFLYTDALYDDGGMLKEYVGGIHHRSRERISAMENLEESSYMFVYYTIYHMDNVYYRMEKGVPSGSVELGKESLVATGTYDAMTDKTTVTIKNEKAVFLDNRILVEGMDKTFDSYSGGSDSTFTVTLDGDKTDAQLTLYSNSYFYNYDSISALHPVKGERYKAITIQVNG